jgi:uncharacterized protein (DUF433 family)
MELQSGANYMPEDSEFLIVTKADIQFGEPCIRGTRVPASAVYGAYLGGDKLWSLAQSYNVSLQEIIAAIHFQQGRVYAQKRG